MTPLATIQIFRFRPVEPSQYVKVCSLYGAGFYYMPGTDMCIKIGGWMRAEITGGNMNGNMTWGPYAALQNNRATSNLVTRERGYITADAREQTAYGVARAYIDVGVSTSDVTEASTAAEFSSNRAFLQWAGFTAGLAVSFYDFYSAPAPLYRAGYLPNEDTGDGGAWVWAYTAQLGGGVSATLSGEERRQSQIIGVDTLSGAIVNGGVLTGLAVGGGNGYGGLQMLDWVGNLRVDQAWGSAQIMGALHEDNGLYYGPLTETTFGAVSDGHPSDAWGWVGGAGIKINTPMIAAGDYFQGEVNYTQGALRYLNEVEPSWNEDRGANEVWAVETDCVYNGDAGTGTGCHLTTAWSINASYEHYWTPQWHQSLAGAYEAVSYDGTANTTLCAAEYGVSVATAAAVHVPGGCNNNFQVWGIGSRLQWDVTKSFYVGVEVMYEDLQGATPFGGQGAALPKNVVVSGPAGPTTSVGSMDDWQFTLRMHKDFLP
jgi:hypothetical protein